MSSIAYITDSKMLELHRLNNHKTMNFWRLSNNNNFSDFTVDDLVFFLSKDKEHMNQKEKGIVGFGRVKQIHLCSVKQMWETYEDLNGYKTLEEFKDAILAVSKDKKLPKKISSFYLEDVVFFQPVYLSECGLNISRNVESYIYIKPEEVVFRLLDIAKNSKDLWSTFEDEDIEKEYRLYALFLAHKKIGNYDLDKNQIKKITKVLNNIKDNSDYEYVQNSFTELYKVKGKNIEILMYNDKDFDQRLIIGQAKLYKHYLSIFDPWSAVSFKTSDNKEDLVYILNKE